MHIVVFKLNLYSDSNINYPFFLMHIAVYDNELASGVGGDIALTDFPQYVCKMRVTEGAYERAHKVYCIHLCVS